MSAPTVSPPVKVTTLGSRGVAVALTPDAARTLAALILHAAGEHRGDPGFDHPTWDRVVVDLERTAALTAGRIAPTVPVERSQA